ncbi:YcaO-like family protein [Lactobacillus sp. ESL0684]|uniref:YcaO-like family protein n=1 Tax=Lactobacillus sp. ESL0684 TaxID=2983213 RepID=UPI0023F6EA09|nr:YcaO-like family protein [Lactobacillus sp. ESL0684]WEV43866.1 YcaO-like family protein [Lactobacillus sp. ESL0684]
MIDTAYIKVGQTYKFFEKDFVYTDVKYGPKLFHDKIGPSEGNAVSQHSFESFKKALSEAIERRILMYPVINLDKKFSFYDLVTGKKGMIVSSELGYSKYIDSTGVAAHTNPEKAIIHAICELIEKNALSRIWYKDDAINVTKIGWQPESPFNKETYFLLNDYFSPLIVVVSAYKDTDEMWHCGLGCVPYSLNDAKKAAFDEMKMIWFQNNVYKLFSNTNKYVSQQMQSTYYNWTDRQRKHLSFLLQHSKKKYSVLSRNKNINSLSRIILELSKTVKHLNIVYLPSSLFKGELSVVKCFSPNLISHVPNKEIYKDKLRNNDYNFIDYADVTDSINCPIL